MIHRDFLTGLFTANRQQVTGASTSPAGAGSASIIDDQGRRVRKEEVRVIEKRFGAAMEHQVLQ